MLVGDTAVGKTCLLEILKNNVYSEKYEPTVLDVYRVTRAWNQKQVELELHDTSGLDDHFFSRRNLYANADVFMLCVSADSRLSLDNVDNWYKEI